MIAVVEGRGGRVAALGVLAVLAALVWLGPGALYFGMIEAGAKGLGQRHELLERYRVLASAPVEPPTPGGPPLLFPDFAEAQAVALLQESVKSAAAAHQVQIRSLQVLPDDNSGEAGRIGIRIRASGDIAGLGGLLYAVEKARPVLYPDNLQIQAPPASGGGGRIEFQLDLTGFRSGHRS